MKTEISFNSITGGQGVALVNGVISSAQQAKRELALFKSLLSTDESNDSPEDIDTCLQNSGIDPNSVTYFHISE